MQDAMEIMKAYVAAVLAYELDATDENYEKCETIWLQMVGFVQGA